MGLVTSDGSNDGILVSGDTVGSAFDVAFRLSGVIFCLSWIEIVTVRIYTKDDTEMATYPLHAPLFRSAAKK